MSKWKSSSRYRLVRSLPTSSSKSAPILPPDFEHFSVEIELLLQSRAHFVHLIVQKCSQPDSFSKFPRGSRALATVLCAFCRPGDRIFRKCSETDSFFTILYEIEFSLESCAHFVDHFPRSSRETAETDTLLQATMAATLPDKNTGFRAGECFQAWMHAFPISHTYFYDDVVAMMIDHHGEKCCCTVLV